MVGRMRRHGVLRKSKARATRAATLEVNAIIAVGRPNVQLGDGRTSLELWGCPTLVAFCVAGGDVLPPHSNRARCKINPPSRKKRGKGGATP